METVPSNLVTLHYDDRGDGNRVAWVTFNNPEKRNALGWPARTASSRS